METNFLFHWAEIFQKLNLKKSFVLQPYYMLCFPDNPLLSLTHDMGNNIISSVKPKEGQTDMKNNSDFY